MEATPWKFSVLSPAQIDEVTGHLPPHLNGILSGYPSPKKKEMLEVIFIHQMKNTCLHINSMLEIHCTKQAVLRNNKLSHFDTQTRCPTTLQNYLAVYCPGYAD